MYQYYIDKKNYCDFDVVQKNKCAPRSYFIPFSSKEKMEGVDLLSKRYSSDKVTCFNGKWDFKFYPNPAELPDTLNPSIIQMDKIDVPACWQFRGYSSPFYLNTRLQFPFSPPDIPTEKKVGSTYSWIGGDLFAKPRWQTPPVDEYNFVGVYFKVFNVENARKRHIISFLGVCSCIDLYINGKHVGYSEGSHNIAEFDITPYISVEENEMLIVVHRWCNGTYMECQDMFRNNGIFRDVLMYEMNDDDIWDVDFKTVKDSKGGYKATATATVTGNKPVTFTLKGHGIEEKIIEYPRNGLNDIRAEFVLPEVCEWSAENPVLYDLYFEMDGCCIHKAVGFKDVKIEKDVFYINGSKVKLRGVNHHDTDPENGYCMTPEQIKRDILICKRYNVDTIRTSHYPPDPLFLELCDKYGLYVIDECDIECHAAYTMQVIPNFNTIASNAKWEPRFIERTQRLYHRDKSATCVIMWSLGNESGVGCNTDATYNYLKSVSTLPVHYEGAVHGKKMAYDVASMMYPEVDVVKQVGEKTHKTKEFLDRPFFLCEYAHAMGVGPGGMNDYWEQIYAHDNLMGGCIWEFADHAVLEKNHTYTYGGDHGEWIHDGNFCVDGLFYPDRTPSIGAKNMAFVYRPVRIRQIENDLFEAFNTMNFSRGDRYEIRYYLFDGHNRTERRKFILGAGPLSKQKFKVRLQEPDLVNRNRKLFVNFEVFDKVYNLIVSREQICVKNKCRYAPEQFTALPEDFSLMDGRPVFPGVDSKKFIRTPNTLIFRAPVDNDYNFKGESCMDDYLDETEKIVSCKEVREGEVVVQTNISCKAMKLRCTDVYKGTKEGILVTSTITALSGKGYLPRFAKVFPLKDSYKNIKYMGRDGESYADIKDHTIVKKVECSIDDMFEHYIKPQENGNRMDVAWAKISSDKHMIKFAAIENTFDLGIKKFSDTELLGMKHVNDEFVSGTYVAIGAFQQGIGSGSCGPKTSEKYMYPISIKDSYTIKFLISYEDIQGEEEYHPLLSDAVEKVVSDGRERYNLNYGIDHFDDLCLYSTKQPSAIVDYSNVEPKYLGDPEYEKQISEMLEQKKQAAIEMERMSKMEAERKIREEAERKERMARMEEERKKREEAERLLREKEEAEHIAREKEEAERILREEAEKAAREKEEAERILREEAEKAAREREEFERRIREEAEKKIREEAERLAREKLEAERIERERLEAERIAREKLEAERIEREKLEAERIAREQEQTAQAARAKEEAERNVRAEIERKIREEAEQRIREEVERKIREEYEQKIREEYERRQREEQRQRELAEERKAKAKQLEAERMKALEAAEKARQELERLTAHAAACQAQIDAERLEEEEAEFKEQFSYKPGQNSFINSRDYSGLDLILEEEQENEKFEEEKGFTLDELYSERRFSLQNNEFSKKDNEE